MYYSSNMQGIPGRECDETTQADDYEYLVQEQVVYKNKNIDKEPKIYWWILSRENKIK